MQKFDSLTEKNMEIQEKDSENEAAKIAEEIMQHNLSYIHAAMQAADSGNTESLEALLREEKKFRAEIANEPRTQKEEVVYQIGIHNGLYKALQEFCSILEKHAMQMRVFDGVDREDVWDVMDLVYQSPNIRQSNIEKAVDIPSRLLAQILDRLRIYDIIQQYGVNKETKYCMTNNGMRFYARLKGVPEESTRIQSPDTKTICLIAYKAGVALEIVESLALYHTKIRKEPDDLSFIVYHICAEDQTDYFKNKASELKQTGVNVRYIQSPVASKKTSTTDLAKQVISELESVVLPTNKETLYLMDLELQLNDEDSLKRKPPCLSVCMYHAFLEQNKKCLLYTSSNVAQLVKKNWIKNYRQNFPEDISGISIINHYYLSAQTFYMALGQMVFDKLEEHTEPTK